MTWTVYISMHSKKKIKFKNEYAEKNNQVGAILMGQQENIKQINFNLALNAFLSICEN